MDVCVFLFRLDSLPPRSISHSVIVIDLVLCLLLSYFGCMCHVLFIAHSKWEFTFNFNFMHSLCQKKRADFCAACWRIACSRALVSDFNFIFVRISSDTSSSHIFWGILWMKDFRIVDFFRWFPHGIVPWPQGNRQQQQIMFRLWPVSGCARAYSCRIYLIRNEFFNSTKNAHTHKKSHLNARLMWNLNFVDSLLFF